MKLRPLLLTLAVLVPAAGAVWWLQRPAPPAQAADARLGQRVADPASLTSATRVRLKALGKTAELARTDEGRWTIAVSDKTPALPADASRLTRLAADLVSPKVERLVTENPGRLATLELDSTEIAFLDATGKTLLELDLGKNADGGGRFLRYGSEPKAYLARLNASIDADATNWRDTALIALKSDEIASLAFAFPGAAPVVISRPDAKTGWTSPATPAGQQVKTGSITTQLTNLTGLRYTQVAPALDPGVIAARVLTRDVTLTTFDGRTVKLTPRPRPRSAQARQTRPHPARRRFHPAPRTRRTARPAPPGLCRGDRLQTRRPPRRRRQDARLRDRRVDPLRPARHRRRSLRARARSAGPRLDGKTRHSAPRRRAHQRDHRTGERHHRADDRPARTLALSQRARTKNQPARPANAPSPGRSLFLGSTLAMPQR